ncbi:MAG: putative oxidoreductase, aryl-alcohol dehydrogenase like protein [Firmicutes bacterium]|nr:putative oxidoreductase, aryl-alcohol dehydrogenase like protein [Bacillota bacterium]
MMARHYEPLFPVLEELNIGFVAFSPMVNGFLTGKYDKNSKFDYKCDYRAIMPQFTAKSMEKNQPLLDFLHETAEVRNATPAQISLAWMICKKPWIVPIPGTRKLHRLTENAGAADIELTPEEVRELDDALANMEMSAVFGGSK